MSASNLNAMVNNIYEDMESVTDVLSQVTPATNYQLVSNASSLYKQGKHVFGNLLFQKSSALSSSQEQVCALPYNPAKNINTACFISEGEWGVDNVAYCYINTSGNAFVAKKATITNSMYYVRISVDYVTD